MKTINITQEFTVGLDMLLKARQERYKHLDKFPELKNVTIVKEEESEGKLHQVRHISIAESMPAVLATILPAGADTLVETSDFEHSTNRHIFKVVPSGSGTPLFVIQGESEYRSKTESSSERSYVIKITSTAFLVSAVVEAAIAEIYSHSLEKDFKSIQHFIEMLETNG